MKQRNSIRIKPMRQGIKIILSSYRPNPIDDILSSSFILVIPILSLIMALFVKNPGKDPKWFIVVTIISILISAYLAVIGDFYERCRIYKIILLPYEMLIGRYGLGFDKGAAYKITHIQNLRLNAVESIIKRYPLLADILFDYESHTVKCCEGITYSDGETLLKSLNEIIRFRCQSVSCIIFGQPGFSLPNETYFLLNPDASELTQPFYHLKTLVILTESYNFMLIEQFLTYAINHIGRTYLKRVVEAHIYGNREKLHPNIRNNLINICKKIYFHDEKASYSVFEKMACD